MQRFKLLHMPLSMSFLGGIPSNEPLIAEQQHQSVNQLAKNHLQSDEELKLSRFNNGHKTTLGLEQLSPRYRELKYDFWKRLAANSHKEELGDLSSVQTSSNSFVEQFSDGKKPSNSIVGCKKETKCGPLNKKPFKIEVVIKRKQNENTLKEVEVVQKPKGDDVLGHVQVKACNLHEKSLKKFQGVDVYEQDGINQSSLVILKDRKDGGNDHSTKPSIEVVDKEGFNGEMVSSHKNLLCHYQRQEHQEYGSECIFGTGGGIGQNCIRKDGCATNTSFNQETCEESRVSIDNLICNKKEDNVPFWNNANWWVVDSYMPGHGKETTLIIRGFEEENSIFKENLRDYKYGSPFKNFAKEKNHSHLNDLFPTRLLHVKSLDVETHHGSSPKWTQQELHKQVAKSLRAHKREVGCIKNGLEMVRHSQKQTKEVVDQLEFEDNGKDEAKCQEDVVHNGLMSIDNMVQCRKGRNLFEEAILIETREKIGGGNIKDMVDISDIPSPCISFDSQSVWQSSIACVGPSTYRRNHEKEIRRYKRKWTKRKEKLSIIKMACCASLIGITIKALQKTKGDASAAALKQIELQAKEMKNLRATIFEMCTHITLLQSEVQGLELGKGFNVLMIVPWQQLFKNIVIAISIVSGTLDLHHAIKSLFQLLFGQARLLQVVTSKKEKTMVAMIILSSSSYIGKELWQIFSQVQAKVKTREAIFEENLNLALQRISYMSTLMYKNCVVHQSEAKNFVQ